MQVNNQRWWIAAVSLENIFVGFDCPELLCLPKMYKARYLLYGGGSATCCTARFSAMLADLKPTLLFLCPRPSNCPGASRLALLAERTPDVPLPTPLLVAELGGYFAPPGSLLADIDGDGDELEECMPFVMMPGGLLTLVVTDCERGAIAPQSAARCPPRYRRIAFILMFCPSGDRVSLVL